VKKIRELGKQSVQFANFPESTPASHLHERTLLGYIFAPYGMWKQHAGSGRQFDSPPPGRSFAMKLLGR
jgi:hypothetical protein